jgi:endonuclease-8
VPEGDTIHRTASRLAPALVGRTLVRFEAPRLVGDRPRPGERVDAVDAVGKHLLLRFSGGLTVRTHLRMTGSWHLYATGERWRKPRHLVRCLVSVEGWDAVCFSAPVVTSHPTATEGGSRGPLAALGPDLCAPGSEADDVVDECVDRMAVLHDGADHIGDVLLDQRVANGVGNVYRSEVCWAEAVHPLAPLADVTPDRRRRLVATAGRLLRANLDRADRTTVPGGLAVYGRAGRPCRRCGSAIRGEHAGDGARIVYWCPTCQR